MHILDSQFVVVNNQWSNYIIILLGLPLPFQPSQQIKSNYNIVIYYYFFYVI